MQQKMLPKLTAITREEQILDNLPEKEKDGWSAPDVYWTEALRQEKNEKKWQPIEILQ